jgi:hypothetical protein
MLKAGELPNIKRHFVDRGLYCHRAVASVPSVTSANLTSLTTGVFPGHHGVTGVNWFDRNQLIWRNYETIAQKNLLDSDYTAATLYEDLPSQTSASLFLQPHRGATKFFENWTSAGPPFFFGWYEMVDRITLYRLGELADIARRTGGWPKLTCVYLLATDFRAYRNGVCSEDYRQALRHTDYQLGRVLGDFERAGYLQRLNLAMVSDHGMQPVGRHAMPEVLLRNIGIDVAQERMWENSKFERRLEYYNRFPCVTYGSGDSYVAINLRKPVFRHVGYEPWHVRPVCADLRRYPTRDGRQVDLICELVNGDAVDAVACSTGSDRAAVWTKRGAVEFHQPQGPGGAISCRVLEGNDPLGYQRLLPADVLNGRPLPPRRWLELTADTSYPDTPTQILAYFRSERRAGDIALFARDGWDFRGQNKSAHGNLGPQQMFTILLMAGPNVPRCEVSICRTVDMAPTVLELLGAPAPPNLDGQSLLGDARLPARSCEPLRTQPATSRP